MSDNIKTKRSTKEARAAIADFVNDNAWRLQGWLEDIAKGVWSDELGEYVVQPDPKKAFELFNAVIEYHVPKLARTELVGDAENPVVIGRIERLIVDPKAIDNNPTEILDVKNADSAATEVGAQVKRSSEV